MKQKVKIRGAYMVLEVSMVEPDRNPSYSVITGHIMRSNFIAPPTPYDEGNHRSTVQFSNIPIDPSIIFPGDNIKLTWFVTETDLDRARNGAAGGFSDSGMRVERLEGEGWDLLYEDFSTPS